MSHEQLIRCAHLPCMHKFLHPAQVSFLEGQLNLALEVVIIRGQPEPSSDSTDPDGCAACSVIGYPGYQCSARLMLDRTLPNVNMQRKGMSILSVFQEVPMKNFMCCFYDEPSSTSRQGMHSNEGSEPSLDYRISLHVCMQPS